MNLSIETTSLAVMALLKAGGFDDNVRKAVEWLTNHRGGYGAWGRRRRRCWRSGDDRLFDRLDPHGAGGQRHVERKRRPRRHAEL